MEKISLDVPAAVLDTTDGIYTVSDEIVRHPFVVEPTIVSRKPIQGMRHKTKTVTDISTWEEVEAYEIQTGNLSVYNALIYEQERELARLTYPELISVHKEDYWTNFPTKDLRIMTIDIECATDGSINFPSADTIPILMIAAKIYGEEPVVFKGLKDGSDANILKAFRKWFNKQKPHVIMGYNHFGMWDAARRKPLPGFDVPYIMDRCKTNNIKFFFSPHRFEDTLKWRRGMGCIWFDVLNYTRIDNKLMGLPNKKLKTVATYLGLDPLDMTREQITNMISVPENMVEEYAKSDVAVTETIGMSYLLNEVQLANVVKLPLSIVSNNNKTTHVMNVLSARSLIKNNIYAFDTNLGRHMTSRYQGAIVGSPGHGFYPEIYKLDFAGYYPNVMRSFNISPETTRIISKDEYQEEFKFVQVDNKLRISIPDNVLNKTLVIEIDQDRDGFLRSFQEELGIYRTDTKNKMSEMSHTSSEYKVLDGKQLAMKVLMNASYGHHGATTTRWGDLAVAVATVGISRYLIQEVVNMLGDTVKEIDTDGVYIDKEVNIGEINAAVESLVLASGADMCTIILELETAGAMYLHSMKNYVIRTGNKLKWTGVAMKSSKLCSAYTKALEKSAWHVLTGGKVDDLYTDLTDLSIYELEDFVLRVSLSKTDYDGGFYGNIMSQAKELGYDTTRTSLPYIVTSNGTYKVIIDEADFKFGELDKDYYTDVVIKALTKFGLKPDYVGMDNLFE